MLLHQRHYALVLRLDRRDRLDFSAYAGTGVRPLRAEGPHCGRPRSPVNEDVAARDRVLDNPAEVAPERDTLGVGVEPEARTRRRAPWRSMCRPASRTGILGTVNPKVASWRP